MTRMMTRWSQNSSRLLIGGGVLWLVKMVAMALGSVGGEAFCFMLGLLLIVLSSIGLGLWVTQQQGVWIRLGAGILALGLLAAVALVITWLAPGVVAALKGFNLPAFLLHEVPVIGTALVALLVGCWLFTMTRRAVGTI